MHTRRTIHLTEDYITMLTFPITVIHRNATGGELGTEQVRNIEAARAYIASILDVIDAGDTLEVTEE